MEKTYTGALGSLIALEAGCFLLLLWKVLTRDIVVRSSHSGVPVVPLSPLPSPVEVLLLLISSDRVMVDHGVPVGPVGNWLLSAITLLSLTRDFARPSLKETLKSLLMP